MSGRKIGVMGVGAIGGSLGGFMTQAGHDVTLIDPWREHVDAMRQHGLLLDGSTGEHRVNVHALHTDELDQIEGRFDILLIAVKSYDTPWAARLMLPYIHDDTWVISPQNGINELQIAPIVGADRTLGCVTTIAAGMYEPAHVTRTEATGRASGGDHPAFTVGELDGSVTPRIREIAELFSAAGLTRITTNLWGERWSKVATNSMVNPTSAMTGVAGYDLKSDDAARKVILNLGYEAVKVGRLLGFDVPVPIGSGYDLDDLKRAATEGYEELEADFVGKPATIPGRPSMAQDVMKGRRTEVEYLNGLVSENGRRIGFPTPYCDAAVSVIKGIEAGEFEVGWENIQRMVSMVSASRKR